jgi:hypothetical protein
MQVGGRGVERVNHCWKKNSAGICISAQHSDKRKTQSHAGASPVNGTLGKHRSGGQNIRRVSGWARLGVEEQSRFGGDQSGRQGSTSRSGPPETVPRGA